MRNRRRTASAYNVPSPAYASCNDKECEDVMKSSSSAATKRAGMKQCGTWEIGLTCLMSKSAAIMRSQLC